MKTKKEKIISLIISVIALVGALIIHLANQPEQVPAFSGMAYVALNNNQPEFKESELVTRAYEYYSPLDPLGRCGYAMACIGTEIMPTEERGSIGQVKPSGWQMAKYDHVDGKYLYNRCHLIGYQLTGENANEQNLITGTRYLNIEGMLPFENMVADFVKETGYHVIYRVTPIFHGDELVARGVQLEGFSVEDGGEGICFNVYAYNSQPGVIIDYATGLSEPDPNGIVEASTGMPTYILNTKSRKFHEEDCGQAADVADEYRETYTGYREALIISGYEPAGCCKP